MRLVDCTCNFHAEFNHVFRFSFFVFRLQFSRARVMTSFIRCGSCWRNVAFVLEKSNIKALENERSTLIFIKLLFSIISLKSLNAKPVYQRVFKNYGYNFKQ